MLKFVERTTHAIAVVSSFALVSAAAYGQQSDEVAAVNAAHEAYHEAFGTEDMDLMSDSWVQDETARLIVPPGKKIFSGWEEVKAEFAAAFEFLDIISLGSKDAQVIVGKEIAWIVDVHELEMRTDDGEVIKPEFFSTHVFHKVEGRWLMVQHQASAPPAPED
ncbi:MAG: YybH family protein [Geminicoccaceae bacterium]